MAAELVRHESVLVLVELTWITASTAPVLACHSSGSLSFESLEQISDETAAALSAHSDWLSLDGVKSPPAAASLVKHEHLLSLRGRDSIADVVAASLATYSGILRLPETEVLSDVGLAVLSPAAAIIWWEQIIWLTRFIN